MRRLLDLWLRRQRRQPRSRVRPGYRRSPAAVSNPPQQKQGARQAARQGPGTGIQCGQVRLRRQCGTAIPASPHTDRLALSNLTHAVRRHYRRGSAPVSPGPGDLAASEADGGTT